MGTGHHNMVVGVRQAKKAIQSGKADVVYLAEDAAPFVTVPIIDACDKSGAKLEFVPTKAALGKMCHIDVDAAVAVKLKD